MEETIFQRSIFCFEMLIPYGFHKDQEDYLYSEDIQSHTFRVDVQLTQAGKAQVRVYDLSSQEEYTNYRCTDTFGAFALQARQEVEKVLKAQSMTEQKRLWEILMIPEVNKYYLTVPIRLREKLNNWDKQKKFYEDDISHALDTNVFRWSIFLKETGTCIGRISCHEAHDED